MLARFFENLYEEGKKQGKKLEAGGKQFGEKGWNINEFIEAFPDLCPWNEKHTALVDPWASTMCLTTFACNLWQDAAGKELVGDEEHYVFVEGNGRFLALGRALVIFRRQMSSKGQWDDGFELPYFQMAIMDPDENKVESQVHTQLTVWLLGRCSKMGAPWRHITGIPWSSVAHHTSSWLGCRQEHGWLAGVGVALPVPCR